MSSENIFTQMQHDDMFEINANKEELNEHKQQPIEWTTEWEDNEKEAFISEIQQIVNTQSK